MSVLTDLRRKSVEDPPLAVRGVAFTRDFLLPKALVYLAPLATAAMVSSQVYGAVEMAYGLSATLGAALIGAPLHGLGHHYLTGRGRPYLDQAAVVAMLATAASLLALAVAAALGASPEVLLLAAMIGVVCLQIELSLVARMLERQRLLGWVQGLALITVCLAGAVSAFLRLDALWTLLAALAGVSALGCVGGALLIARHRTPGLGERLWRSVRTGAAMAAFGVLNSWAGVSGRVLIGFVSLAELPAYAAAFRVAGLGVGLYQVGTTIYWARLYRQRTRDADRLLALLLASTALLAVLISLAGPPLFSAFEFLALPGPAQDTAAALVPLVTLQTFFWAANSILQPRVYRAGVARRLVKASSVIAVVGAVMVVAAARAGAGLVVLCWLLALYSASFFCGSLVVLLRRGLPHWRTGLVGLAGGVVLAALAMIQG